MVRFGVTAILGPQSESSADHVQSMCQTMRIPHIQTHWDPKLAAKSPAPSFVAPLSVNLYPSPSSLSRVRHFIVLMFHFHFYSFKKAYASVIRGWNWRSFTVLYEDEEGLIRLQDVIQLSTSLKVQLRPLPIDGDYRYISEARKMHAPLRKGLRK